ncbi:hypothetical protein AAG570_014135 [Ranatra chinensis]|uniref:Uncharacterized protein n=1 Tax=Ranatra chinensis TaxID=642074 RepID=A0ABD0XRS9_9HEMI
MGNANKTGAKERGKGRRTAARKRERHDAQGTLPPHDKHALRGHENQQIGKFPYFEENTEYSDVNRGLRINKINIFLLVEQGINIARDKREVPARYHKRKVRANASTLPESKAQEDTRPGNRGISSTEIIREYQYRQTTDPTI